MTRPSLYLTNAWQPPAAFVTTPIHDEVAALPMSDETAHAIAREWLRDIAAAAKKKAKDIIWHASPATDRDLTGAFPVVAVAA